MPLPRQIDAIIEVVLHLRKYGCRICKSKPTVQEDVFNYHHDVKLDATGQCVAEISHICKSGKQSLN